MRAVRADRPGPPSVLHVVEVPDPRPGPGEVAIDVAVAGITFVETQVRAGRSPRPGGGPEFPFVPGNGVGGTVAEAGDGVDPSLVGRRVVTTTGGSGGYAERVVVAATEPHPVPASLDTRTAVALLADGRTALALARAAEVGAGDTVLVTAAGGGVGSLLVQLARRAGATVIALAGGDAKLARVAALGADLAIDYRRPGWAAEVRAAIPGPGADVAFDGVGGEVGAGVAGLLADGGRLVVHGMASGAPTRLDPAEARQRKLRLIGLADAMPGPGEIRAFTAEALAAGAEGWLVPTIGQTWPLERAAEAHAAIEARTTLGKSLLVTGRAA